MLCSDICKRLDFVVFSDKDDKLYARLPTLAHLMYSVGRSTNPLTVLIEKSPL